MTVNGSALSGPVTVTNAGGSTASVDSFSVLPKITGFSPTSGGVGTFVTINGSGLAGTSDVQFNGVSSSSVTQVSAQQVKATVPAGAATGTIQVVTGSGSTTSTGSFTVTGGSSLDDPISENSFLGLPRRGPPPTAPRRPLEIVSRPPQK